MEKAIKSYASTAELVEACGKSSFSYRCLREDIRLKEQMLHHFSLGTLQGAQKPYWGFAVYILGRLARRPAVYLRAPCKAPKAKSELF